jgi:membrane fusion protein, multidrug efflux system
VAKLQKKHKHLLPILIVGGAAALVAWLVMDSLMSYEPEPPQPIQVPPVNVRVMTVSQIAEMPDTFDLPAVVEANRVVTVSAEVAGRVEKIYCREGDPCEGPTDNAEPKPLIALNRDLLQAEFERAQAVAERARKNFEKVENLWKQGAGTEQGLIDAQTDMIAARATSQLAKAQLKRAIILPPISGVLDQVMVEQGEYVQPGNPLVKIVDVDTVKVVAMVPEQDIAHIRIGSPAEVFTDSFQATPDHTGEVTYISQLADQRTRATRVEVTLKNKERELRSGRIVKVRLARRILRDVIMVPLEAVIPLENGKEVYVAVPGPGGEPIAERREIQINTRFIRPMPKPAGMDGSPDRSIQAVQVLPWPPGSKHRGLHVGDRLIIKGHQFVAPEQALAILDDNDTPDDATPTMSGGPTGDDS